jgi:type I restriction enzyme S subunit
MAVRASRATLGDYFTLQRGNTYKSRLLGLPGPVLLGLATIQRNGGFRSDSLQTYGGDSPDKLLVQPGDLYLSLKDVTQSADLLGAVARLPRHQSPGRLTQDTVKLEPKSADVPVDYLYWLLRTPQYRAYCRSHATGTTNLGLAREDFLAFPASEPSSIQLGIADTLTALEDKVELNDQIGATLEAMARALFKCWFVDFEPVRAKMQGRDVGLPRALAHLLPARLVETERGEIPEGWVAGTVASFSTPFSGGTPSKKDATFWGGEIPWITPKAMTSIHVDDADEYVTGRALGNGTRLVPRGTTLVMVRGMGLHEEVRVSQARRDVAFNQDVKALVPRDIDGTLLLYALLDAQQVLLQRVESSGHGTGRLPTDLLMAHRVTIPQGPLHDALADVLCSLNDRIALAREESRTLTALRDALLPKLISGKLRVNDAGKPKASTS